MSSKKTKATERAERAAAVLAEAKRKERKRNMIITSSVVLLVVVALVAIVVVNNAKDKVDVHKLPVAGKGEFGLLIGKRPTTPEPGGTGSSAPSASSSPSATSEPEQAAEHEVIIYEDFLCPFCGELETRTHERLAQAALDGKVYVDYRPYVLLGSDQDGNVQTDSYSARALNAFRVVMETAGPEVAKEFHDLLFRPDVQPSESAPAPDDAWLIDRAVEAGADRGDVTDGIENQTQMEWVKEATKQAFAGKVYSTPTVILDGKELTNFRTVDDLADALLKAVE